MTLEPRGLAGYASLADPNGVRFYGTAQTLREVANLVRQGSPAEIALDTPPEDVAEGGPIRGIRVSAEGSGPIELRTDGHVLEIVGGRAALSKLAATVKNLADTPQPESPVPAHVDLEHFSGHGFLSESSMWMTIILLPEPRA